MDKVEEKKYIFAIGRRKSSTAEVRLYRKDTVWGGATIKKGECVVNGKPALEYFGKSFEKTYKQPFQITGTETNVAEVPLNRSVSRIRIELKRRTVRFVGHGEESSLQRGKIYT